MSYRPTLRGSVRAFVFTDRFGHTLASALGFVTLLRWWSTRRVQARRAARR